MAMWCDTGPLTLWNTKDGDATADRRGDYCLLMMTEKPSTMGPQDPVTPQML